VREATTLLTADEFDNFPFDETKRYELDEGKLIVSDRLPERELAGDAALTSPLLPGFSLPLSELSA